MSKKHSGFMLFAKEFVKKKNIAANNITQLNSIASQHWNRLSDDEKKDYKERAAALNERQKRERNEVLDLEVELMKTSSQRTFEGLDHPIAQMIKKSIDTGNFDDQIYYLVSTTTFFEDAKNVYPAEIAIAKFSLRKGVFDDICIPINPGKLPMGSLFLARERALTHQFPIPDQDISNVYYLDVLEKIVTFVLDSEFFPVLFTGRNSIYDTTTVEITNRVLCMIFDKCGEYEILPKVYSVIDLLRYLHFFTKNYNSQLNINLKTVGLKSATDAAEMYGKFEYSFNFMAGGCDYHYEKDATEHCCLSKVRRYGYILSTWCAECNRFPLIKGAHYPEGFNV